MQATLRNGTMNTEHHGGRDNGDEVEGLDPKSGSWGDYPLDDLLIWHENRTIHDVIRRIDQSSYVSDSEKRDFRRELTFSHPGDRGGSLFCTWHGKVSHLTLRLHFSWPIKAGKPVHVVYAGPKITKR